MLHYCYFHSAIVRSCLILIFNSTHVPSFYILYYSFTIIIVYFSSNFILAISMREVYCVRCTPPTCVHAKWSLEFVFVKNSVFT